jgi:hypothetical protein
MQVQLVHVRPSLTMGAWYRSLQVRKVTAQQVLPPASHRYVCCGRVCQKVRHTIGRLVAWSDVGGARAGLVPVRHVLLSRLVVSL